MPALFSLWALEGHAIYYTDKKSCVLMFGSTASFLTSLFYNSNKSLYARYLRSVCMPMTDLTATRPQPRTTQRLATPAKRHQASDDQRGPEGEPPPVEAATSQPAQQRNRTYKGARPQASRSHTGARSTTDTLIERPARLF